MGRNLFIDYLKGIAIFLVVWGHGIQFLDVKYDVYNNWLFMFVYSFHMPLFMCISGYLFAFSKKKKFGDLVKVKFKQLLLPILCWGLLFTWLVYHSEIMKVDVNRKVGQYIWLYVRSLPYHLWFLWALFVISVLVSLLHKLKYNQLIIHGILFFLLLSLPDNFGFSYVKFMYPFFMMGYFFNIYSSSLQPVKRGAVIACYIIFPLCFIFWTKSDLIYFTKMSFYGTPFFPHLWIVCLRYLIGFTGIISSISFIKKFLYFPKARFITTMGIFSLGIYILQTVFYLLISPFSLFNVTNIYAYTLFYTPIVAIIIIYLSILLTKAIGKFSFASKLLFGGRY